MRALLSLEVSLYLHGSNCSTLATVVQVNFASCRFLRDATAAVVPGVAVAVLPGDPNMEFVSSTKFKVHFAVYPTRIPEGPYRALPQHVSLILR